MSLQEHALAVAALAQLAAVNFSAATSIDRYFPIITCAAALYGVSRFCTAKDCSYSRFAASVHTWAATALLAALAWHESPQPWLAVIWVCFALVVALVDRIFTADELPYQAHLLAALAVLRVVTLNLDAQERWHGIDLRLITTSIVIMGLLCLACWVRLPQFMQASGARHAYTWTASSLLAWLLWSELPPVATAPAWALLGLLLFEIGAWKRQKPLRWQAFVGLTAAFIRIFFVNLNVGALPGHALSPRLYTIIPTVLIDFYFWGRLQKEDVPNRSSIADLVMCFGSASLAALLYFETSPEWTVVAWASFCVATTIAALVLDRKIFMQHGVVLVGCIVARSLAHNLFGASYFISESWRGRFYILSIAITLLFAILPIAFRLRRKISKWQLTAFDRWLAIQYPEQVFFFAPCFLVTLLLAVKMNPGLVTLSWSIEGVIVILLGLLVSQRSYRLTGLFILLVCVGKIIFRDAWLLDERDRYTTFIALGAALVVVSILYGKYREVVRRLL